MAKLICFDLEGPLSPQDNAYELMGLIKIKNGYKLFEVISRYDDLLTLEGRANYEPGDTLALIAPLLVYHKISEEDIKKVSARALIIKGAKALISSLKARSWKSYIISTSYEQHAYNIGASIGIPLENIVCTSFPLDNYVKEFENEDFSLIQNLENDVLALYPPIPEKDSQIKELLDKFFFKELQKTRLGKILKNTQVIGGERKVKALRKIAEKETKSLNELVVVGDSITDFKMLKLVHEHGGLAIVFNGNEYAIPYGTVAIASKSLLDLLPVLERWEEGLANLTSFVKALEKNNRMPYYHYLGDKKDFRAVIKIHKAVRKMVRGEAGKLG